MNFNKQLKDGLIYQNPVLVQVLGMCSTMAITTSFFNGLGMGLSVLVILTLSNIIIAALRKIIPNNIRIACFIVVIAGFVTIVDLCLQAFIPALSKSLGLFIPLIVVNCIILGRAESFAYKNGIGASALDGIFQGLGYTMVLVIMCVVREFLGNGTIMGGLLEIGAEGQLVFGLGTAAGIRILARVMISYHELYGFSLNILDIDPTFTLGDMERQRQITIERLQREGVWDINRENPLPQVVQRIAIVSSRQAAGYQDFCKELGKSPYAFSLTLFDAFMQGAGAEDSIVAALDAVADRMDDFDAVVLIRGGGSASDLNCFNAYRLCAHIAQFPLPILTGIGHDKDTSVADMVAHTALKTPTAVAGWLVERMTGVEGWLDTAALQLRDASAGIFRRHELRLAELGSEIAHQSALLLLRRNEQLSRWSDELSAAVGELLRRQHTRLTTAEELIASRSPEHILSLGFAIVHRGDETVTSAKGLSSGDTLRVELSDGTFDATVK